MLQKVTTYGVMEIHMKESGKTIRNMVKVRDELFIV